MTDHLAAYVSHHMAQSAKSVKTLLSIDPFWDLPRSSSPISWTKRRTTVKLAITSKHNIELEDLLALKPTTVTYPPERIEEPMVDDSNATSEREHLTKEATAKNRWKYECKIRDYIGNTFGDKPWDQVDRKLRALIYLTISHEGRWMHPRSHPRVNVGRLTTKDLLDSTRGYLHPNKVYHI